MTMTDDIIRDLYPLYATGEVSADTRALIEGWLATHPALAEELRRGEFFALPARPTPAASGRGAAGFPLGTAAEIERAALRKTKALLRRRGWAMAAGIFFTFLPLSFAVDDSGLHFLFWTRANAAPMAASAVLGIAAWVVHARTGQALKPSGF